MSAAMRLALALLMLGFCTSVTLAQTILVNSEQILTYEGAETGARVDGLIWRGGLNLISEDNRFGGISGITYTDPDNHTVMVTDQGQFISGELIYDEFGAPISLVNVSLEAMRNSRGAVLPRAFSRDAEAIETITRDGVPSAVRVGFENLTRVADFQLVAGRPTGAAIEIAIPDWISRTRNNQALESVCIAPQASPIAGSTLLILEDYPDVNGDHSAWLLGNRDQGALSLVVNEGLNPTDCAFLPDGDLLVLERGIGLISFTMALRRIPADEVRPGARMTGEFLLQTSGGDIDNMEGLAVHPGPDGQTRITLVSDNNFNGFQRNLLLEFSLPE
jgi:hypothetical protein